MAKRSQAVDAERGGGSAADADFLKHLASFLAFALFFFALNVLTSFGDWWFYWPVFFWGWAVIFHAARTYGAAAPAKIVALLRSMLPGAGPAGEPSDDRRSGSSAASPLATNQPDPGVIAGAIEEAEARVARLWRVARQIPEGSARERAFGVCAAADRVAEVLAQDKDRVDGDTVRWFVDRLLSPTESLLDRYARLATRGVDAAEPTLVKVADEDLPRIEARLDTLYQQLHRRDVVDLAVSSEMVEFGLDDAPPLPVGSRASAGGARG